MKTTISILILAFGFFINTNVLAVNAAPKPTQQLAVPVSDLSKGELENIMGRKVKLKEWFAFKLSSKNSQKNIKHKKEKGGGSGFGLAGFIMGVLGLASLNLLFAILGIVFSAIAMKRMKASGYYGEKSFAKVGLILGIIGVVLVGGLTGLIIATAL